MAKSLIFFLSPSVKYVLDHDSENQEYQRSHKYVSMLNQPYLCAFHLVYKRHTVIRPAEFFSFPHELKVMFPFEQGLLCSWHQVFSSLFSILSLYG